MRDPDAFAQGLDLRLAGLGRGQFLGGLLLELGAAFFEAPYVLRTGKDRLALRDQEVATEAGLHRNLFTQATQVCDFFQKNDFHRSQPLTFNSCVVGR